MARSTSIEIETSEGWKVMTVERALETGHTSGRCVHCGTAARVHRASVSGMAAHVEHLMGTSDCPLSDPRTAAHRFATGTGSTAEPQAEASQTNSHSEISQALRLIFDGIAQLKEAFPNRAFTIDGRLVGDIGEVIAELEYDLKLDDVSAPDHDACTSDGRLVQIKATFKNSLTFKTCPNYYLGFKLYPDGRFEEVFNGPGDIILGRYPNRKGIGKDLLSFPIKELRALSGRVPRAERVRKRAEEQSSP